MTTVEAKKRAPYWFALLVFLQVVLISLQSRPGHDEQSLLRSALMTIFAPVERVASGTGGGVGNFWHNYADLRHAREQNVQLQAEVDQLKQQVVKSETDAAQAARLRQIISLQPSMQYNFVVADVIARNTSLWLDRITIDKGTLNGVQKDYPVVSPAGVVGHIVAVAPNAAHVQLITDERAGVGVRLAKSRAEGEIKGVNGPFPEVRNISNLEDVEVGEDVVTSGLDGIYPPGLLVGKILSAEKRSADVTQKIVVQPAAHLGGLEEVMVLQVDPGALRQQIEETLQSPANTKSDKKTGPKSLDTRSSGGKPKPPKTDKKQGPPKPDRQPR